MALQQPSPSYELTTLSLGSSWNGTHSSRMHTTSDDFLAPSLGAEGEVGLRIVPSTSSLQLAGFDPEVAALVDATPSFNVRQNLHRRKSSLGSREFEDEARMRAATLECLSAMAVPSPVASSSAAAASSSAPGAPRRSFIDRFRRSASCTRGKRDSVGSGDAASDIDDGGDSDDDAAAGPLDETDDPQPGATVIEGFLVKRGGRLKVWRRRWFRVSETHITYSVGASSAKCKGKIPLRTVTAVEPTTDRNEVKSRKHCFAVHTPRRVYFIDALSTAAREQWVTALLPLMQRRAAACSPRPQ